MKTPNQTRTLADRLGRSVHVSPLRQKLRRLARAYGLQEDSTIEDWLVDMANARGARVVERPCRSQEVMPIPAETEVSNEELVVALCQLQCLDRPQILRLAAQLITREAVRAVPLLALAKQERAELVVAELARQALRVNPAHPLWKELALGLEGVPPPPEPLIHWTRLAEPVPVNGLCDGRRWKLVA